MTEELSIHTNEKLYIGVNGSWQMGFRFIRMKTVHRVNG